MAYTLV